MSRVIHITSNEEWAAKLRETQSFGGKAMVVDFSATWCGPCKMIGPVFDKLSVEFPNVIFVKVDVDELSEVAQSCGVRAMPTFMGYHNGAKVDEFAGADPRKLQALIESLNQKMSTGAGHRLGGAESSSGSAAAAASSAGAPADDAAARRAKMAAAAEARLKAMSG